MDGILLVDKPSGWTSFDVVAKVRSVIRTSSGSKIKVGHTGTLDPLATGLLVLLVGKTTKRAPTLSKLDKTYEATIQLGTTSTTGDEEGEKTKESDKPPTEAAIKEVIDSFIGEIEQVPPAFSAVKVGGQRAYKLARQGKEVKIEPRKVTIYYISDISIIIPKKSALNETAAQDSVMPMVKFTAKVSSGTYIRTLAEDIGKALGTGAYLTNLKRTQVGPYALEDAINVQNISTEEIYIFLKPT